MKPIRIAVVGAGHLGRFHTRILSALSQYQLVGVVDPVESACKALADQYTVESHTTCEKLYGRIDAAVVAAPTQFHHAIAMDLLSRGVHLLVEKPLAANHADATDLVDAAKAQRAVLQVGHVERFNPAWSAMVPYIREPKYIEGVRRGGYTFRSTDIGVVLDLMIHDIDLVLSIVQSPVRSVDALGMAVFGPHEDIAQARITFENGCVANLSASRASHSPARTMQLWSQRGFASLDFTTRTAKIVQPSEALLRRELNLEQLSPAQKGEMKDKLLAEHLPVEQIESDPIDAITAELVDFAESIHEGRMPRVSGRAACEAVGVAEQILSSIAAHQWDGHAEGRVGPMAVPSRSIIPGPHWSVRPVRENVDRRAAG